jgi:hypothetical protein
MNQLYNINDNSTSILSIIPFGNEEVFDIGVANHHNFIANGIVVSNCIPSRMTIGQLLESILSKASALDGHVTETIPFDRLDSEDIGAVLKTHGFDEHGLETLYCGFTGKKIEAKIFICPTHYLRLKHLVQDKIHCLDDKHDVLTSNGWKNIKDINITDMVATLDSSFRLVYENPVAILSYPDYEGNMYYIENDFIDLAVTGNHRMLVSKDDINYGFELAENLVGQTVRYKKDAIWDVVDYQIMIGDQTVNMDLWLIFFGICFMSGYENDKYGSIILSISNESIRELLLSVLKDMRYIYSETNDKVAIYNEQLYNYIELSNERIPDWVYELSRKQVQILINTMLLFDNCILFAEQLQQLCLHAGWDCIIENNLLNIIKNDINPYVNKQEQEKERLVYEKCPVYCLQVPSEIFYVRRNGKAVWTGNSRARGPVTLLTHQPPEGRSRDGGLRFGRHFAKKQTQNVLLVCVWQATQSNCGEVLITIGIVWSVQY